MKTKMYTVYDSKVGAHMLPQHYRNSGEATRAFTEAVNDPKSQFAKHPSDFTLFEIGEYDDETASVETYQAKISLGNALQFKNEKPELSLAQ